MISAGLSPHAYGPSIWISEIISFVLQSSHLEDSESAALLCCECEDSEIFSDSNVRRYLSFYSLLVIQVKAFRVNLALQSS